MQSKKYFKKAQSKAGNNFKKTGINYHHKNGKQRDTYLKTMDHAWFIPGESIKMPGV